MNFLTPAKIWLKTIIHLSLYSGLLLPLISQISWISTLILTQNRNCIINWFPFRHLASIFLRRSWRWIATHHPNARNLWQVRGGVNGRKGRWIISFVQWFRKTKHPVQGEIVAVSWLLIFGPKPIELLLECWFYLSFKLFLLPLKNIWYHDSPPQIQ